ncbi:hypothetical protein FGIG_03493 [Fasciola gigantica]|uniref:Uncharacterized protein n=1 Tax=Fasciola gigantica TaxID=46835 RepID=A0A504YLW3_FASGI|nr:hypothetical protein FGIG_03493 [Fasciola gigantica]
MHLTGSSLEHPLPSREYTQNLLQWIYDREPDRFKTNCFELHSVTSERRRTLVQVVFQFNFIIPSTDYGPEEWIYCAIPPEPGNAQLDQKRGKNDVMKKGKNVSYLMRYETNLRNVHSSSAIKHRLIFPKSQCHECVKDEPLANTNGSNLSSS